MVDPYQQQVLGFADESAAYQHFLHCGGFAQYLDTVRQQLPALCKEVDLVVGFSAGGAALFQCLTEIGKPLACQFLVYYPGQVRKFSDWQLQQPLTAIWSDETHFSVVELVAAITQPLLNQRYCPANHGFMNPQSNNFDESLARAEIQLWSSDYAASF